MQRSILAVSATLLVFASCADSPAIPTAVVHEGPTPDLLASPDGPNTIGDLLDDPLVQTLVESVHDRGVAQRLREVLEDLAFGASQGHAALMHYALAEARSEVAGAVDASDAVLLAMLSVVLDEVQSVLASASDTEQLDDRQAVRDELAGHTQTK